MTGGFVHGAKTDEGSRPRAYLKSNSYWQTPHPYSTPTVPRRRFAEMPCPSVTQSVSFGPSAFPLLASVDLRPPISAVALLRASTTVDESTCNLPALAFWSNIQTVSKPCTVPQI